MRYLVRIHTTWKTSRQTHINRPLFLPNSPPFHANPNTSGNQGSKLAVELLMGCLQRFHDFFTTHGITLNMIPQTNHEDLISAMELFDQEQRNTEPWSRWETNKAHKFAIKFNGALYPVKQIISLATELPVSQFSGGEEFNNFVQEYGFEVISLEDKEDDIEVSSVPGPQSLSTPRVWWVNQSISFSRGLNTHSLWAHTAKQNGRMISHWKRVEEVRAGDIIAHYGNGQVRAISRATSDAYLSPCPPDHDRANRGHEGYKVDEDHFELEKTIPLTAISSQLLSLNIPNGPLDKNGGVKQGYFFAFSQAGLDILKST